MNQESHFEHGDVVGEISLTLKEGETLNHVFAHYVQDYNPDRLEAFAFRVLLGQENVLTLFAVDNFKQENNSLNDVENIPVKKYKITNLRLEELLNFFGEINFTVSTNLYPLESIKVINK